MLRRQRQQARRMLMTKNRLGGLAIAAWARAFIMSAFMHGKASRVDSQLYEVTNADVLLQDGMRDLKTFAVLGVHTDTIYQLVAIGKSLFVELLLQVLKFTFHLSSPFNL